MSDGSSLLNRIKSLIDSGKLELPVMSEKAFQLQSLAAGDDFNMNEVEHLIRGDQTLTAEVLKAANSAFFGGLASVQTIRNAVVRLGLKQVARLVFLASERSKYHARNPGIREKLLNLWRHASTTSHASYWLARRLNFKEMEDVSFLGGLLHDVGHLVILRALDDERIARELPADFSSDLLDQILQSAHTEIGSDLLQHWNIPDIYVRIARNHHLENFDPADNTMLIVRVANHATAKVGASLTPDPCLSLNALPEAQSLGASDILLAELEIMLEDLIAENAAPQKENTTAERRAARPADQNLW
jgi:HD-like signal output (HDOD) protein